jgi:hypothetical protein
VPATRFGAAADKIELSRGTCSSTAAMTLITIFRRGGIGAYEGIMDGEGASSNLVRASFEASDVNFVEWSNLGGNIAGNATTNLPDATNWYGVGVAKSAGSTATTLNIARRQLTTPNATATQAGATATSTPAINATQMTRIIFGLWNGTDDFNGWIGAAAWFNGALTTTQMTECFANRQTSDIWNCSFGRPAGLWQFNASGTITDLTGNGATETSRVGTTLDAAETPPWTFNGTGSVTPTLLPHRNRMLSVRTREATVGARYVG